MSKILVADDETKITKLVCTFLKNSGFETLEASDGEQALSLYFSNRNDVSLIILDIMMPGQNGWEVCKTIRKSSNVPIIMLTARSEEFDELMGYETGADDYVTKPFSPSVLVKRVEALLRRTENSHPHFETHNSDDLEFNNEAHEVKINGIEIDLTLKEYNILKTFLENPGKVFSREQLLDCVWGIDYVGDIRTVDSHVARLRTKLGKWGNKHLKTVYGVGYKIEGI